jgi:hypothetical protein
MQRTPLALVVHLDSGRPVSLSPVRFPESISQKIGESKIVANHPVAIYYETAFFLTTEAKLS